MATQSQLNTTIQSYRDIHIKIDVLDFDYYILDEISGLATSAQFSINADSDVRRSCNINMILKNEYGKNALDTELYWKAGNPFWFDKYLRINIGITEIGTNEIVWSNQGIYLINEPSIQYDATTNQLHFEGVDLMAKLTGLRDGNLEGLDYVIEPGTNITSVIKDVLKQQNFTDYVILKPPQSITPYEIKIGAGGTAYDLLTELRDINVDWEMFFDVDGVFYFQPIPSSSTPNVNIVPQVTNEILNIIDVNLSLDTSFGDVKNYVEVYGEAITTDYTPKLVTVSNDTVYITVDEYSFLHDTFYDYSFSIGDVTLAPEILLTPITTIDVTIGTGINHTISLDNPMLYNNMTYAFRITGIIGISSWKLEYLGYVQPFGVAWDNNEESPFYVGENKENWDINKTYHAGDMCYYSNACYYSNVDNNKGNIPFDYVYWTQMFSVTNCTDAIYNKPQFTRQVRIVLSGGEYDNIYSNELAMQRAKYEIYLRSRRHDNISLTVVPIYWLDVNQIMEYKLPNEDKPSYWLIKEVSTNFDVDGTQTITAIRYYTGQ